MASAKTKAIQAPLTSTVAGIRVNPAVSVTERQQIIQTSPGKRDVRSTYSSADGRALYAHDGISVRRVR